MNQPSKKYATATAFRRALEERLKQHVQKGGGDLQRLRRQVAFDRFLCRLFLDDPAPWVLKGGYAMELRIGAARATKDIDLTLRDLRSLATARASASTPQRHADHACVLQALQEAASQDLGDFFRFEVGEPSMDLDGAPYGGARYPVAAHMDGRPFIKFHLDVGIGDVVLAPLEMIEGQSWLVFAGISGERFPTISKEQQFAEKLHAYTLPRENPNSRVKDLVDMVLLIKSGDMQTARIKETLVVTFERRATHPLPTELEDPPVAWEQTFAPMATACAITESLQEAVALVKVYYASLGAFL